MSLPLFCKKIGLDEGALEALATLGPQEAEVRRLAALFHGNAAEFYRAVEQKPHKSLWFLLLYLHLAMAAKKRYGAQKIAEDVYYSTFADIALWEREHWRRTGEHGLGEYEWLAHHLRLELFRLGRLQFQPILCPFDATAQGGPALGQPVLNVHIPQGGPLGHADVLAAYRRAARFWALETPLFVCESWMLSPALDALLPPGSNLLAFGRDYRVVKVDGTSRQAEERIFGQPLDNPAAYPAATTLQRKAKAWLCAGHAIPSAWGVYRFDKAGNGG